MRGSKHLANWWKSALPSKKMEPGKGPWNLPVFPVPKKKPGEYRIVQDLRALNEVTIKDGFPIPRIDDLIQKQAQFIVWSAFDLKDGFHQMPLKREHRHTTCMTTPHGTMQWTCQVMGLKNASSQFERMVQWCLDGVPGACIYIDDLINGGKGLDFETALRMAYEGARELLLECREYRLVCDWEKCHIFQRQIEFCGHLLKEGRRSPAPGKLLPIQLWELPDTVTALRGFLGLTNYYSEYVHHYSELAAPSRTSCD